MKKKIILVSSFILVIVLSLAVGAYASTDIKLFVNGKQSTADVQIIDGSSYVPLRAVAEMLGADVKWDGDKREIHIAGKGATEPVKTDVKSYNVKVNLTSGPMKLDITKVALDPAYKPDNLLPAIKAIVIDVSVENTSTDTVRWYPNQKTIVTNTKEQVDAKAFYSDDVGGDFIGKVVKTGKIAFEVKGDLASITSFNYKIDGPVNEKFDRLGEDKTVEVILK